MDKITTTRGSHGYSVGETIVVFGLRQPWYIRFWRWITRYKPPTYVVTSVTSTEMTIEAGD